MATNGVTYTERKDQVSSPNQNSKFSPRRINCERFKHTGRGLDLRLFCHTFLMERSSSQALGHMTPRVLKYTEANSYTFVRGRKLELLKRDNFQICLFTVYYDPFANLVGQNSSC